MKKVRTFVSGKPRSPRVEETSAVFSASWDPPADKEQENVEFEAAVRFYENNRSDLLKVFKGKFIAILGERPKIVDSSEDFEKLALRVYERFGYRDIFMPKVERKPRRISIPSPMLRV